MRLLLDQGLPRTAADLLRSAGMDAVHTGECGLATASDIAILEYTRAEDAIVVTLDADFHALMALSGATQPSVIRIRIERLRAAPLADFLQTVLAQCRDDLAAGALVSVDRRRVRVRARKTISWAILLKETRPGKGGRAETSGQPGPRFLQ